MSKIAIDRQKREYIDKIINQGDLMVDNYRQKYKYLNNRTKYNMYETIQTIKAQESGSFLTGAVNEVPRDLDDERENADIITRTIDTSVANTDIDTDNLDTFAYTEAHQEKAFFAKTLNRQYMVNTNFGQIINEFNERITGDGNILVRYDKENHKPVEINWLNMAFADTTARHTEDTDCIEEEILSLTKLNAKKGKWQNIKDVIEYCDRSDDEGISRYVVRYYYVEMKTEYLNNIRKEVYGDDVEKYESLAEQCLIVYVRAKNDLFYDLDDKEEQAGVKGFVVYADKLAKEEIDVTKEIKIIRYKPYEFLRLEAFNGRLFGRGHREIGIPNQNKANKINQRFNKLLDQLKIIYGSSDKSLIGKNIISGFQDGQIINYKPGTDFKVINNQFPNLQFLVEEWNRNIQELEKNLKAFEVATGENLPASTSATAVAVSNDKVGKYYSLKREKLGFLFGIIWKRWIIKDVLESTDMEEKIEIVGDPFYINQYIENEAKKIMNKKIVLAAMKGEMIDQKTYEFMISLERENLKKQPKLFKKLEKDYFKDVEIYVGLNTTNENYNKQAKAANGIALMNAWANQAITQQPQSRALLEQITKEQGYKVPAETPQPQAPAKPGGQGKTPAITLPTKEKSKQEQLVENAV